MSSYAQEKASARVIHILRNMVIQARDVGGHVLYPVLSSRCLSGELHIIPVSGACEIMLASWKGPTGLLSLCHCVSQDSPFDHKSTVWLHLQNQYWLFHIAKKALYLERSVIFSCICEELGILHTFLFLG